MRHGTRINLIVLLGLLIGAAGVILASRPLVWTAQAQESAVLYVKPTATGEEDCDSWNDACTLQTALSAAVPGDEIWVAEGIHKPGTAPTDTFQLQGGVAIYGGFVATETLRTQRDWAAHLTVLSGDIDDNDLTDPFGVITDTANISGTNSYHVVTCSGVTETAVLDGFTVSGGNADGVDPDDAGGGMFNALGSPTLTHITFSGNRADGGGGGIANTYGSSPALVNVIFADNSASSGGGMSNQFGSGPTLVNATFHGNTAAVGGGMYNQLGNPTLVNVAFSGNTADEGGGMYSGESSLTLVNVTFSGNTAVGDGGGMCNVESNPALVNVTFSGNTAGTNGGGMYNDSFYPTNIPTLTNCILWGNTATNGPQIYNQGGAPPISYSDIQGSGGSGSWDPSLGTNGGGNIDADPRFVDADGADDIAGTPDDNLRLVACSPAIDAGENSAVPSGVTTDLDGHPRFVDIPARVDIGNGTVPIVDMGAYEAQLPGAVFVDADATGADSGGSWADAFTDLQDALSCASAGGEIWVAEGIYRPTSGTDPTATFQLVGGAALYGGFAATETLRTQRDWAAHPTVLSGDIDDNDLTDPFGVITDTANIRGTNSYHVVTGSGVTETAVLDGFTVSGGNADGADPDDAGGGMFNALGSPTLANVTFSGNWATYHGGGMYNSSSGPTLTNVTFSGNYADGGGGMLNDSSSPTLTGTLFISNSAFWAGGGGMHNLNGSSPTLTGTLFISNTAYIGGGMLNSAGSSPTLVNVAFSGNSAISSGGGMFNIEGSSPTLTNVTFSGNTANDGGGMCNAYGSSPMLVNVAFSGNTANLGGGMFNEGSSPTLVNITFSGNTAENQGGGISSSYSSTLTITNSILWGNNAGSAGAQIYGDDSSTLTIGYSLVQGWENAESGHVYGDRDPQFVDPTHGDLRLESTSPAIDAGDNSALPADTLDLDGDGDHGEPLPLDLAGNPRRVDIPEVPDTGAGPAPIVDMGAYEAQELTQFQIYLPVVLRSWP